MGWQGCVHFCERGIEGKNVRIGGPDESGVVVINDLEELRKVWSHIFTG
jgi:pyrimidine and pyridine-specific 5'-nucleotidase